MTNTSPLGLRDPMENYKRYPQFEKNSNMRHTPGNDPEKSVSTAVKSQEKPTALFQQIVLLNTHSLQNKIKRDGEKIQSLLSEQGIHRLPQELLIQIFSHGSRSELLIWEKVCKLWQELCRIDSFWKPIVISILPQSVKLTKANYYQLYRERTNPLLNLKNQRFTKTVLIKNHPSIGADYYVQGIKIQNTLWLKKRSPKGSSLDKWDMNIGVIESNDLFGKNTFVDKTFLCTITNKSVGFQNLLTEKKQILPIEKADSTLLCKEGNLLVSASKKGWGAIQVWDLDNSKILRTILIEESCCRLVMRNKIVYSLSKSGSIAIYDLSQNLHFPSLKIKTTASEEFVAFLVDQKNNIFITTLTGKIFIFDIKGKQRLINLPEPSCLSLCVQGNYLIATTLKTTRTETFYVVHVFHLNGKKLCTLEKVNILSIIERKLLVYDEKEDCIAEWDFGTDDDEPLAIEQTNPNTCTLQ